MARLRADPSHENERTKAKGSRVGCEAKSSSRFSYLFMLTRTAASPTPAPFPRRVIVTSIFYQLVREEEIFFSRSNVRRKKGKSPKKEKKLECTELRPLSGFATLSPLQPESGRERESERDRELLKWSLAESHENTMRLRTAGFAHADDIFLVAGYKHARRSPGCPL